MVEDRAIIIASSKAICVGEFSICMPMIRQGAVMVKE
jgi:hypothetical protein